MNKLPKIVKLCFCITAAFMTALIAQGQSVDEIISKHIDVVGGKKKLKKVNSLYMTVTSQIERNSMKSVGIILDGKGFISEADFNGQSTLITSSLSDYGKQISVISRHLRLKSALAIIFL